MIECNDDCLNCSFPRCKYDKSPKVKKPKKDAIHIEHFTDHADYMRQYQREYYKRNKERIREHVKKYRLTHKEKVNEIRRRSYYKNRNKELERQKEYYLRKVIDG